MISTGITIVILVTEDVTATEVTAIEDSVDAAGATEDGEATAVDAVVVVAITEAITLVTDTIIMDTEDTDLITVDTVGAVMDVPLFVLLSAPPHVGAAAENRIQ